MKNITLTILLLLAIGCEKEDFIIPSKTTIFSIKKDDFYSKPVLYALVRDNTLKVKVNFSPNTAYLDESINQINKLVGFSDCTELHHDNSARFGWRYVKGSIYLYPYIYTNGVRDLGIDRPIGPLGFNKDYELTIKAENNKYIFVANTDSGIITLESPRGCSGGLKYLLQPYFGGKVPAPHDMNIKVEIL